MGVVQPPPQDDPKGCLRLGVRIFAVATALVALAILGIGFSVFKLIKSSAPYQDAVRAAHLDARVADALGAPFDEGFFVSGKVSTSNGGGSANLDIPLKGPKGRANLHVEGTRSHGVWTYTVMTVTPENGGVAIDLLVSPR